MQLLPEFLMVLFILVFDASSLREANGDSNVGLQRLVHAPESAKDQIQVESQLQFDIEEDRKTGFENHNQINWQANQRPKLKIKFQKSTQEAEDIEFQSKNYQEVKTDQVTITKDKLNTCVQNDGEVKHQNQRNTSEQEDQGIQVKRSLQANSRKNYQLQNNVRGPQLIKFKDQMRIKLQHSQSVNFDDMEKEINILPTQERKNQMIKFEDDLHIETEKTQRADTPELGTVVSSLWTRMKTDGENSPKKTLLRTNSDGSKHPIGRTLSRSFSQTLTGAKQAFGTLGRVTSDWGKTFSRRPLAVGKVESPRVYKSQYGQIPLLKGEQLDEMTRRLNGVSSRQDVRPQFSPQRKPSVDLNVPSILSDQIPFDQRANLPPREENAMFALADRQKQPGNRDPNDGHAHVPMRVPSSPQVSQTDEIHMVNRVNSRYRHPNDGHKHVPMRVPTYPNTIRSDQIPFDKRANISPGEANFMFAQADRQKQSGNRDPNDAHVHIPMRAPTLPKTVISDEIPFDKLANIPPKEANAMFALVDRQKQPGNRDPNDGHVHVPMRVPTLPKPIKSDQISFDQQAKLKPGEVNSAWASLAARWSRNRRPS